MQINSTHLNQNKYYLNQTGFKGNSKEIQNTKPQTQKPSPENPTETMMWEYFNMQCSSKKQALSDYLAWENEYLNSKK